MKSTSFESKFNELSKYILLQEKVHKKVQKSLYFCLYFKTYCNNFLISACIFISDLGAPYSKQWVLYVTLPQFEFP